MDGGCTPVARNVGHGAQGVIALRPTAQHIRQSNGI